jgi:Tol biopolymer transport system component
VTDTLEHSEDIGSVRISGRAVRDEATGAYTVTGSGENMWGPRDAFHYIYTQISGDVSLAADISFIGEGADPHRKACLVIRQSLEAGAAYADAALHGDGLTSLQFRLSPEAATHEIQANQRAPQRLKIEKRGDFIRLYVQDSSGELIYSGAAQRIAFSDPFYIGLGVCSHNADVAETAVFSNVEIVSLPEQQEQDRVRWSTLETLSVDSGNRAVVYATTDNIEAPNWMPDGQSLLFNSAGRLFRIPVTGGSPEPIDTGFAVRCNNDHGISPDGKTIVISDQSTEDRQSRIYTLPITGGEPVLVTPNAPSYWHGWSPDGRTLAYCARREDNFDIYTIPAGGGEETRLTTAPGLDDGPEYSPDGTYIYFNSERTGLMQIWRMRPNGSDQEQVTFDDYGNWFPHLSPDGSRMAFLSYNKEVTGHPPNKDVLIRILDLSTREIRVLAAIFGGQGTMNVPNWSSDSRRIAFVSYQQV